MTFFSIALIFVLQPIFLSKILTLGFLFSTAVNVEVVAKPLILKSFAKKIGKIAQVQKKL